MKYPLLSFTILALHASKTDAFTNSARGSGGLAASPASVVGGTSMARGSPLWISQMDVPGRSFRGKFNNNNEGNNNNHARGGDGDDSTMNMLNSNQNRAKQLMDRGQEIRRQIEMSPYKTSFIWLTDQLVDLTSHLRERYEVLQYYALRHEEHRVELTPRNLKMFEWVQGELQEVERQLEDYGRLVAATLNAAPNDDDLQNELQELSMISNEIRSYLGDQLPHQDDQKYAQLKSSYDKAQASLGRLNDLRRGLENVDAALSELEDPFLMNPTETENFLDQAREEMEELNRAAAQGEDFVGKPAGYPTRRRASTQPTPILLQLMGRMMNAWRDTVQYPLERPMAPGMPPPTDLIVNGGSHEDWQGPYGGTASKQAMDEHATSSKSFDYDTQAWDKFVNFWSDFTSPGSKQSPRQRLDSKDVENSALKSGQARQLPDTYEAVAEWATKQPGRVNAEQVMFQLRNQRLASEINAGGSTRWGDMEESRAIALAEEVWSALDTDLVQNKDKVAELVAAKAEAPQLQMVGQGPPAASGGSGSPWQSTGPGSQTGGSWSPPPSNGGSTSWSSSNTGSQTASQAGGSPWSSSQSSDGGEKLAWSSQRNARQPSSPNGSFQPPNRGEQKGTAWSPPKGPMGNSGTTSPFGNGSFKPPNNGEQKTTAMTPKGTSGTTPPFGNGSFQPNNGAQKTTAWSSPKGSPATTPPSRTQSGPPKGSFQPPNRGGPKTMAWSSPKGNSGTTPPLGSQNGPPKGAWSASAKSSQSGSSFNSFQSPNSGDQKTTAWSSPNGNSGTMPSLGSQGGPPKGAWSAPAKSSQSAPSFNSFQPQQNGEQKGANKSPWSSPKSPSQGAPKFGSFQPPKAGVQNTAKSATWSQPKKAVSGNSINSPPPRKFDQTPVQKSPSFASKSKQIGKADEPASQFSSWQPGQPPRGDVKKAEKKSSWSSSTQGSTSSFNSWQPGQPPQAGEQNAARKTSWSPSTQGQASSFNTWEPQNEAAASGQKKNNMKASIGDGKDSWSPRGKASTNFFEDVARSLASIFGGSKMDSDKTSTKSFDSKDTVTKPIENTRAVEVDFTKRRSPQQGMAVSGRTATNDNPKGVRGVSSSASFSSPRKVEKPTAPQTSTPWSSGIPGKSAPTFGAVGKKNSVSPKDVTTSSTQQSSSSWSSFQPGQPPSGGQNGAKKAAWSPKDSSKKVQQGATSPWNSFQPGQTSAAAPSKIESTRNMDQQITSAAGSFQPGQPAQPMPANRGGWAAKKPETSNTDQKAVGGSNPFGGQPAMAQPMAAKKATWAPKQQGSASPANAFPGQDTKPVQSMTANKGAWPPKKQEIQKPGQNAFGSSNTFPGQAMKPSQQMAANKGAWPPKKQEFTKPGQNAFESSSTSPGQAAKPTQPKSAINSGWPPKKQEKQQNEQGSRSFNPFQPKQSGDTSQPKTASWPSPKDSFKTGQSNEGPLTSFQPGQKEAESSNPFQSGQPPKAKASAPNKTAWPPKQQNTAQTGQQAATPWSQFQPGQPPKPSQPKGASKAPWGSMQDDVPKSAQASGNSWNQFQPGQSQAMTTDKENAPPKGQQAGASFPFQNGPKKPSQPMASSSGTARFPKKEDNKKNSPQTMGLSNPFQPGQPSNQAQTMSGNKAPWSSGKMEAPKFGQQGLGSSTGFQPGQPPKPVQPAEDDTKKDKKGPNLWNPFQFGKSSKQEKGEDEMKSNASPKNDSTNVGRKAASPWSQFQPGQPPMAVEQKAAMKSAWSPGKDNSPKTASNPWAPGQTQKAEQKSPWSSGNLQKPNGSNAGPSFGGAKQNGSWSAGNPGAFTNTPREGSGTRGMASWEEKPKPPATSSARPGQSDDRSPGIVSGFGQFTQQLGETGGVVDYPSYPSDSSAVNGDRGASGFSKQTAASAQDAPPGISPNFGQFTKNFGAEEMGPRKNAGGFGGVTRGTKAFAPDNAVQNRNAAVYPQKAWGGGPSTNGSSTGGFGNSAGVSRNSPQGTSSRDAGPLQGSPSWATQSSTSSGRPMSQPMSMPGASTASAIPQGSKPLSPDQDWNAASGPNRSRPGTQSRRQRTSGSSLMSTGMTMPGDKVISNDQVDFGLKTARPRGSGARDGQSLPRSASTVPRGFSPLAPDQLAVEWTSPSGDGVKYPNVDPRKLYEMRSHNVAAAATAGRSRWGTMENQRAVFMTNNQSNMKGWIAQPPPDVMSGVSEATSQANRPQIRNEGNPWSPRASAMNTGLSMPGENSLTNDYVNVQGPGRGSRRLGNYNKDAWNPRGNDWRGLPSEWTYDNVDSTGVRIDGE